MLRVAMLSRWHVHADEYAKEFANHPDAHIQAVWDEDPLRGKAWADELSAGWFEDLDQLLSSDSIDAVSVVTPTNLHREVMVKAAKTGKHIFTEKVLATTISEANEIAKVVGDNGVTFCISYPRRNLPEILYAKQAADKGAFGVNLLLNRFDVSVHDVGVCPFRAAIEPVAEEGDPASPSPPGRGSG